MNTPTPTRAPARPLRIVLVDDHAIVRQGLRTILERESDLQVVGEAGTAGAALAVVEQRHPDIVLLDLKLGTGADTEGLDVCSELTARFPEIGVLVLTTFLDDALVLEAVQRGAKGYVLKDVDTSALVSSLRAVARDEGAFDPRSASVMMRTIRTAPGEPVLTEREIDVLGLLARGLSNREIGARLYISETTVKFHVRNLMRKLSAATRAEAVYEASKMGLI